MSLESQISVTRNTQRLRKQKMEEDPCVSFQVLFKKKLGYMLMSFRCIQTSQKEGVYSCKDRTNSFICKVKSNETLNSDKNKSTCFSGLELYLFQLCISQNCWLNVFSVHKEDVVVMVFLCCLCPVIGDPGRLPFNMEVLFYDCCLSCYIKPFLN